MFISKYSTYVSISVAPDHISLRVAEAVCLMQDTDKTSKEKYIMNMARGTATLITARLYLHSGDTHTARLASLSDVTLRVEKNHGYRSGMFRVGCCAVVYIIGKFMIPSCLMRGPLPIERGL